MIDVALSPPEFAKRYGVNADKVRAWIKSGELRAVNVATNRSVGRPRWRITPEAAEAFELVRSAVAVKPQRRKRKRNENVIDFF